MGGVPLAEKHPAARFRAAREAAGVDAMNGDFIAIFEANHCFGAFGAAKQGSF